MDGEELRRVQAPLKERYRAEPDGRLGVEVRQLVRDCDGKVLFDGVVRHVYRFHDGLVLDMRIESI